MAVLEGALLLRLAPEDLVVAVGVEGRVDVDQVHAGVGELAQLLEVVAAVDDAGVDERRGAARASKRRGARGPADFPGLFSHGG